MNFTQHTNKEIVYYISIQFVNYLLLSQYCSSPHCAQRWGLECPHWQPLLTQHAQLVSSKSCGQVHPEAFSVHRSICPETKKIWYKNKPINVRPLRRHLATFLFRRSSE